LPLVSGSSSTTKLKGSLLSCVVSRANGSGGGLGVPVGASGNDVLAADVASAEAEVVGAERRVGRDNVVEVAGDAAVETYAVARGAAQVAAEEAEAGVELFKNDSLSLDLADLLSDDPFGHLLEDEETLLDDFDGLAVAYQFLGLLDDSLAGDSADEVIRAVEVIETSQRREASPVIERVSTSDKRLVYGEGFSSNTRDEGRGNSDFKKLGEHFE